MLTGSRKAAPRPWTLEGLSGGGGGGVSGEEGFSGFLGSSGKRSSAMIYMAIIGFFEVFLGVGKGRKIGAEWVSTASFCQAVKLCRRQDRNPGPGVKYQQVFIAADQGIGFGCQRQRQEFVVPGIAAGRIDSRQVCLLHGEHTQVATH